MLLPEMLSIWDSDSGAQTDIVGLDLETLAVIRQTGFLLCEIFSYFHFKIRSLHTPNKFDDKMLMCLSRPIFEWF